MNNRKLKGAIRLVALVSLVGAGFLGVRVSPVGVDGGNLDSAFALTAGAGAERLPVPPAGQKEEPAVPDSSAAAVQAPPDSIIAYYFHRTFRCQTCLMLEASSRKAIDSEYAQAVKDGTLRWRLLNFEEPAQAKSAEKYQLVGPSLVLSHWKAGVETEWKMMDEIWEHVDDPDSVSDCVSRQLKECLAGQCRHKSVSAPDSTFAPEGGAATESSGGKQVQDND